MIRSRICASWSEPLLVAHFTLFDVSCCSSFMLFNPFMPNVFSHPYHLMCPFPILGFFIFSKILKETFVSKQWGNLVLQCVLMSHKKDAIGLYGLIEQDVCMMGPKNKLLSITSYLL